MKNQWRSASWRRITSLSILCITILGFIAYFIIVKMVQSDTMSESFQPPQKVSSSKPTFAQQEWTFPLHRELTDYEVIAENNLFRPLGWKREDPLPATPTVIPEPIAETPPAPPPTYALVLTGIVKNGADWIAVVEDRERGEGMFLRRGETLKDAQVQDIMSEYITLARGEMTVQLALGDSIEYGIDGRVLFDTTDTAKMPEPVDKPNTSSETEANSGDDAGQSLLERMRERRRKELGQ